MRNGASEPINAALATLLCVAPAKNGQIQTEEHSGHERLTHIRHRDSPASAPEQDVQTTLTVTIRQNATRAPGDSARFTRVELSEKAMTRPTTASTPRVFAFSARVGVGEA